MRIVTKPSLRAGAVLDEADQQPSKTVQRQPVNQLQNSQQPQSTQPPQSALERARGRSRARRGRGLQQQSNPSQSTEQPTQLPPTSPRQQPAPQPQPAPLSPNAAAQPGQSVQRAQTPPLNRSVQQVQPAQHDQTAQDHQPTQSDQQQLQTVTDPLNTLTPTGEALNASSVPDPNDLTRAASSVPAHDQQDIAMGVIRKKTAARGAEGGVKYVCDVCSADITSTVRIKCASPVCTDYDLCVLCFSKGESSHNHQPATHPYKVIEQNSVPIYAKDWGADEEALLLEGAEIYGLGSWADIADHIGGYRDKDEVREHYDEVYLQSKKFPLPERADPTDMRLLEEMPREEFQVRKKQRIEERKDKAKNALPATPKAKPTASVPSCHEIQGYMPGRLEFETEYQNEAEEAVQLMQFDPGEGINPRTGQMEPEMDLKMTVMGVYNERLTQRAERKKVIFEHNLLDYRKNAAVDKKRTKEERDIVNKTKPFARMMNKNDYEEFVSGLIDEHNLRTAIAQLQDWRINGLTRLSEGEKYERDKAQRAQKQVPMGSLDRERYASSQRQKAAPIIETPSGAAAFVAPGEVQLPERLKDASDVQTPGASPHKEKVAANGQANGALTPQSLKQKSVVQPLSGVNPLSLTRENIPDMQLLTPEEVDLCEKCRMHPKPYLVIKEVIMKEAMKGDGKLKKKQVKELCGLDSQKGGRIFDFFVNHGWIGKA